VLAAVTRSPGEMVVEDVRGPQRARVMAVDPVASRRDLAGSLGAEVVTWAEEPGELVTRARDWTRGEGPPLVIETSGAAPLRPGIFPEKEIDVLGSSTATAADFRAAISLVTEARENLSKLFSHHFPLARAAEAFEFALSRPPDAVKIVVNVN